MSPLVKKQPDEVVARVLKRVEVGKIARQLQSRLALALFKTKLGWEDLTLDSIELTLGQMGQNRRWDVLSDSSSSIPDLLCPTRTLMSSPPMSPRFSDAASLSTWATGHRKCASVVSFENATPCPSERYCVRLAPHKSRSEQTTWKDGHQLAQSSPIKTRGLPRIATSAGPGMSSFQRRQIDRHLRSPNFARPFHGDEDPWHSHLASKKKRPSPPRTPMMQSRSITSKRSEDILEERNQGRTGEEGADLVLYLAASPSPAVTTNRGSMGRLSTPPPMSSKRDLPALMATPGEGTLLPNTPEQSFDFADFVHTTPSPAQIQSRTAGHCVARTSLRVGRRLTFED